MVAVALQMSGHLRGLCDSAAHFEPLVRLVAGCRAAARCDLFVHTWDELYPQTPSWHTWYPSDVPNTAATSQRCVEQLRTALRPAAIAIEHQTPSHALGNATWNVAAAARAGRGGVARATPPQPWRRPHQSLWRPLATSLQGRRALQRAGAVRAPRDTVGGERCRAHAVLCGSPRGPRAGAAA